MDHYNSLSQPSPACAVWYFSTFDLPQTNLWGNKRLDFRRQFLCSDPKTPMIFPVFLRKKCWNLLNSCLTTGEISCKLIWSIHLIENTCFPLDLPKISQSVELRKNFLAIKFFVAFLGLRLLAPSFVNAPHTPNSSSTRVAMRAEGEKEGEVSWKRRWS